MNAPFYYQAVLELVGGTVTGPADGPIGEFIFYSGQTPPTEEQIQTKLAELQSAFDAQAYSRDRQKNYPNEHDLLIALWEKVMEGRSESADALEVKRQEVKTANPKPE